MIWRWLTDFFIGLLPDFTFPPEVVSGMADAVGWIGIANYYIPFGTFLICLGIFFVVWVSCAVISAILQLL